MPKTKQCIFCGGVADFVKRIGQWLSMYKCRDCGRTWEE